MKYDVKPIDYLKTTGHPENQSSVVAYWDSETLRVYTLKDRRMEIEKAELLTTAEVVSNLKVPQRVLDTIINRRGWAYI